METSEKGTQVDKENDLCVTCNAETPHKRGDHIDTRPHYVEGAGQLCKKCWEEIYEKA